MEEPDRSIPSWRVFTAFVLTPLIAAFAFACLEYAHEGPVGQPRDIVWLTYVSAIFFAYPATVLLGFPAYLILRRRVAASILSCAVAGAVLAALPFLLFGMVFRPDAGFINGHVTDENGTMTWWGLYELLSFTGRIAAVGALAGSAFWLICAAGLRKARQMSASV